MRAAVLEEAGKQGRYRIIDCADPSAEKGQSVIRVSHAGINRADLLQKQGKYPLPTGAPAIPGLEVSGEIIACESGRFKIGDKVCALVSEGAFAEMVAVADEHILPAPESISLEQAAALPEACFTVWISLTWQAALKSGESVLIHGGSSGIGTIGIQIAHYLGARVFATAGTQEKCALCEKLGAEHAILYKETDFVAVIKDVTQAKGVNVILDMVGGDYFGRNLEALAHGGRLAIIALLKGAKIEANISAILLKHLKITGSTLRSRPAHEKAILAREVEANIWPGVTKGLIKPLIDNVFSLNDAEKALDRMDQGLNIGKILLKM